MNVNYSDTFPEGSLPPKRPAKGKLPRSLQDRSKYKPHQGPRECQRRLRQMGLAPEAQANPTDG